MDVLLDKEMDAFDRRVWEHEQWLAREGHNRYNYIWGTAGAE